MSVNEKKSPSKTKPGAVPEAKTESKDKSTPKQPTEGKSGAKEPPDKGPAGYSIGERQKAVTKKYRQGWEAIFGKKR